MDWPGRSGRADRGGRGGSGKTARLGTPTAGGAINNPIDLSRFVGTYSFAGSAVRPMLTVEYSVWGPFVSAMALVGTGVVSALLPAWRAVRVPPADALANR